MVVFLELAPRRACGHNTKEWHIFIRFDCHCPDLFFPPTLLPHRRSFATTSCTRARRLRPSPSSTCRAWASGTWVRISLSLPVRSA